MKIESILTFVFFSIELSCIFNQKYNDEDTKIPKILTNIRKPAKAQILPNVPNVFIWNISSGFKQAFPKAPPKSNP